MAQLILVNIEQWDRVDQDTPFPTLSLDPDNIKIIKGESGDLLNDRAYFEYYDNQRKALRNVITTETAAAIRTAAIAAGAGIDSAVWINTIDKMQFEATAYLQQHDSQVYLKTYTDVPDLLRFNFGERNHADHKDIEKCPIPTEITDVDFSNNAITIRCCMEDRFPYGTSIVITGTVSGSDTYTVISSACDTDRQTTVIVLDEALDAETIAGDTVDLT